MKVIQRILIGILFLVVVGTFLTPVHAFSETVSLPLSIEYPLLRSIIIKTAYTDREQTAVLLNENDGCKKVIISEPDFRKQSSHVFFKTKVYVRAGAYVLDNCVMPVEWEGYLALVQRPVVDDKWNLSFETLDSTLYDKDHKPAKIAGIIWDLVKGVVHDYLGGITINLAPPVSELKSFLFPLFPEDVHFRAQKLVDSMRPGRIIVSRGALEIAILTEVELEREKTIEPEPLSEEELKTFIDIWEAWDVFLVEMATSLWGEPLSDDDRQILMETMLETRHRFTSELLGGTAEKDFVREQFVETWLRLSPIFKNHLGDDPSRSVLGYLALFTAADALVALDRMGPTLGIEMSRRGLIRLMHLLTGKESVSLAYSLEVNSRLREIFGLGAPLKASGPIFDVEELELNTEETGLGEDDGCGVRDKIVWFMVKSAWAKGDGSATGVEDIKAWIVSKDDLDTYLERVMALLNDASDSALNGNQISERYHGLYQVLVLSTAWQESCLRQFKVRKSKVTYLLSYNRTSVGLMQINERVWRGMYDPHHLRWNIKYNAAAGCEILDLYLRKYALRRISGMKGGDTLDDDTVSRMVYAMYNGGPGQFHKFLKRMKTGKFYSSDKLYFEKYSWVKNNEWHNIRKCLVGG